MGHRVIKGLVWAAPREKGPWGTPRPKGAKREGLKYERLLGEALPPGWVHGKWFEFQDSAGRGWCQPDFFFVKQDLVVVLEAKYTWVPEGQSQIQKLYRPVLARVFSRPVVGVVVCKVLTPEAPPAVGDLSQALWMASSGTPEVVLQWIGVGPLRLDSSPRGIDISAQCGMVK